MHAKAFEREGGEALDLGSLKVNRVLRRRRGSEAAMSQGD